MPIESGLKFNPETASTETREKILRIRIRGDEILLKADVPLYVWNAIDSEDWSVVAQHTRERAEKYWEHVLTVAAKQHAKTLLAGFYKQEIYYRFADAQLRAGNDAWEVPPSLQAHTMERL